MGTNIEMSKSQARGLGFFPKAEGSAGIEGGPRLNF